MARFLRRYSCLHKSTNRKLLLLTRRFALAQNERFGDKITAICIRDSGITYEVVWWSDAQRHCDWLSAAEVIAEEGQEKMDLGHYL